MSVDVLHVGVASVVHGIIGEYFLFDTTSFSHLREREHISVTIWVWSIQEISG